MVLPLQSDSVRLRPFLRREYDRLVGLGVFERERVELVRGVIVAMSPIGTRHAEAVTRLTRILVRALGDRAAVRVQSPLGVGIDSEPEPDLAVVPPADYSDAHPDHALLVIEVADSSLDYDRKDKARLYAEAGVGEYWVVNLIDDTVEVHRGGRPDGHWETVTTVHRGGEVTPVAFPDLAVTLADALPRPA